MSFKLIQTMSVLEIQVTGYEKHRQRFKRKEDIVTSTLFPFAIQQYLYPKIWKAHKLNWELITVLLIIDVSGLKKEFKRDQLCNSMYHPVKISLGIKKLIGLGYLVKSGPTECSGKYSTTEKYDDFIISFKHEYRKATKRFSDIERMGDKRKQSN